MRTQQQAEKEEQQRIKNLVLNYDLRESEDQDGDLTMPPLNPNTNIHNFSSLGHDKPAAYHHNRPENKTGKERSGQRARKLQLSDVDWYGRSQKDSKHHMDKSDQDTATPGADRGRDVPPTGTAVTPDENQPETCPVDMSLASKRRKHSSAGAHGRPRGRKVVRARRA